MWKTEGRLHDDARRLARVALPGLLVAIAAVSAATPFLEGQYYARWFVWPGLAVTLPMPLLVAGVGWMAWRAVHDDRRHAAPFGWSLALFALTLAGLAVSIWPDVIPGRVSIWQAAAPASSQLFMLVGGGLMIPLILAYTGWAYWVFRGKVAGGYH